MKASEWGASLETGLTDNISSYSISHTVQEEESCKLQRKRNREEKDR